MKNPKDVKNFAQSLRRTLLETKDVYLAKGESLEIISKAYGMRDWNTFSAYLRKDTSTRLVSESVPLSSFIGYYVDSLGYLLKVFLSDGQLKLLLVGEDESSALHYTLEPIDDLVFHCPGLLHRITFQMSVGGNVTGANVTDGVLDASWSKVDKSEAEKKETDLKNKIRNGIPLSISKKIITEFIASIVIGRPRYDFMGETLAQAVSQQLPQSQDMLSKAGKLHSIKFIGIQDEGSEVYHLQFEKRLIRLAINIDKNTNLIMSSLMTPGG